jgi:serine/threonine-protein kinase
VEQDRVLLRRLALAALVLVGAALVSVLILELRIPDAPPPPLLDSPDVVVVPDLAGTTEAEASSELMDEGFDVVLLQEPSLAVAEGHVIRTEPAAGTAVPRGSTINLVVSSGQ